MDAVVGWAMLPEDGCLLNLASTGMGEVERDEDIDVAILLNELSREDMMDVFHAILLEGEEKSNEDELNSSLTEFENRPSKEEMPRWKW